MNASSRRRGFPRMTDTSLDSANMFELAASLPDQIAHSVRAARNVENLPDREKIEQVVVLGMGDSAIAGEILVAAAAPFMPVPVLVVRSYELPAFVGEGSLVFAISYSGQTEETLEVATEAAVQGAKVVVVSSGGRLAELAGNWGAPVVRVPKNIGHARMALGALSIPPIAILEEIGLFPGASQWIDLAIEQLLRRRDELSQPGSIAEKVAEKLDGKVAIIHGGGAVGSAAAQRWKTQINQNANLPAFSATQPEICHNEVLGWTALPELTREVFAMVSLRHDDEHPQVSRRFDIVDETIAPSVATVIDVRAEGDGGLAQLLDLILIGDYMSLHLAARVGVDPRVNNFREEMQTALSHHSSEESSL